MKNYPTSLLSPEELHTGTSRMVNVVEAEVTDDEYINELLPPLKEKNDELADYIGKDSSSEYTDLLSKQDEVRDKLYTGFRDYCISFCNSYDASKAEAGILLNHIFHERGFSLQNYGYASQTSSLIVLFKDLDEEKASNAIATLDGTEWYNKLKEEQAKFEQIYQEKVDNESVKQTPQIKAIKKELSKLLNSLLTYIDQKSVFNPEKFGPLVDKLDEIITDIVAIARARQTRKENASEKMDNDALG
jgi:hypothetical protein